MRMRQNQNQNQKQEEAGSDRTLVTFNHPQGELVFARTDLAQPCTSA